MSREKHRARAFIGVDIGGTKARFALFDEGFKALEEEKKRVEPGGSPKELDRLVGRGVKAMLKEAERRGLRVTAVGAGCAGSVDSRAGLWRDSPNIPRLKDYPLRERLARLTGHEAAIGNDIHMGLYGEHRLGAAKGLRHVLGFFFGTGVGGAVIIDGKLHVGASGRAGEIGHSLVYALGPLAGSERQGVLDDIASRSAIAGAAAAAAAKHWAPRLQATVGSDVSRIRSGALADSIKGGDRVIEELVRARARAAGIALSNLVDFLSPEMVVLGGGLVHAMPTLFVQEVAEGIRRHTMPWVSRQVKVAAAKLGDLSVAAGAACLAWDRLQVTTPRPTAP